MSPRVPVSWGELLDKITILEIKSERLTTEAARANASSELWLLWKEVGVAASGNLLCVADQMAALREVNGRLWDLENIVRGKEAQQQFDNTFIEAARAIYRNNDERARFKREINAILQSAIIEEKEHAYV